MDLKQQKVMNILALETTGKYGSAAVINDRGEVFTSASSAEMNHLKDIITISDEAIRLAGIKKSDLTHVAASAGPGSFTGIRIGVTTARTLSQMLDIPCIGVSSLEGMAYRVLEEADRSGADLVAAVINARRHQTYAAVWEKVFAEDAGVTSLTELYEERQYMIEELLDILKTASSERGGAKVFFTGDGIDAYGDIIRDTLPEGSYILADESIRYQDASSVARIAMRHAEAGRTSSYDELLPEYMRLSEAEQRLKSGTLSDKIRKLK